MFGDELVCNISWKEREREIESEKERNQERQKKVTTKQNGPTGNVYSRT